MLQSVGTLHSGYVLEFVGNLCSSCSCRDLLLLDLRAVDSSVTFLSSASLPLSFAGFVADIFVCALAVYAYIFTSGGLCL